MAKKDAEHTEGKKEKKRGGSSKDGGFLSSEARHGIYGVLWILLALILILAAFKGAGEGGAFLYKIFSYLFGVGYFLLPILALILGASFIQSNRPQIALTHTIGSILFLGSGLALVYLATGATSGGFIGKITAMPFSALFGNFASVFILGGILLISIMILMDAVPNWATLGEPFSKFFDRLRGWNGERALRAKEAREAEHIANAETAVEEAAEVPQPETEEPEPEPIDEEEELEETPAPKKAKRRHTDYIAPPLSLLAGDRGKPNTGDIKANANIIKRTLQTFGIEVEMDEITVGPTVTRYALKPAEGVKLSRIVGLQNDLALALAAHPIRIEAPIPGKSLVGIEIPNKAKSIVGLATLLGDPTFSGSEKRLMVALGRTISGGAVISNIAKMPHALIAGATGSGKSVTIHSVITSLLYRNGPDDLRLIFIDPKRVELTLYNGIPHLLTPVITEPKKAILALKWAAKEMDRRYDMLEKARARDIESYNSSFDSKQKSEEEEGGNESGPLPYIVIIIDELADIMQSYPRELESAIVRLAQMSRAVGIHLILSTQRPSVNVITGLIKANIPARVALQVASQIDSRTILDAGGAEKLLGAGDMLWSAGDMATPERLQSAFISENEVKSVVKFIIDHSDDAGGELSLSGNNIGADKSIFEASIGADSSEDDDELYEEARQTVIEAQKASTSFLQRKLGIGYARAARLVDILEERGVIGPGSGAKPREVLEKSVSEDRAGFQ
jgi:S-DNA-T family DNA segregation ATPase FtsK/SpoIIIE